MSSKPPYRVPTMAELAALPWNGLNVVSTFAGGGGSSTGYRMAGCRVLYANEFVPAAADTYRANARPGTIVDTTDIRQVTGKTILEKVGLGVGELDIFDGSPPCASFSTAGKRSAKWGQVSKYSDTSQRTDDLFYEYARLVKDIQPRVFVAENVSGLVKGVAKGYFKAILAALRGCGYVVAAKVLDASWLGVPQARQRLIFVGVREDLGKAPAHPKPFPYQYTVRDALPWLSHQAAKGEDGWGQGEWRETDRPSPTIGSSPQSGNGRCPPSFVQVDLASSTRSDLTRGQDRKLVQHDLDGPAPTVMAFGIAGGHRHQTAVRLIHDTSGQFSTGEFTDRPSPTILVADNSSASGFYQVHDDPAPNMVDPETGQSLRIPESSILRHGSQSARKLTLGELRAICSFPPDYQLTGNYAQRWERCGRSVPPLMMKAIASTIQEKILCAG